MNSPSGSGYDPATMATRPFRLVTCALLLASTALAMAATRTDPNNITGSTGLVMIDKRGSLVRFFDPATLKETGTVDIGGIPHELAISPDHRFAYIPIYGDGVYGANPNPGHVIAIVDLTTRKMTGTIDVSPAIAPHGLRVDEKGILYAVCDLSRKLLVIDPKSRTVQASIDIEGHGHWLAVLPDGSKAYTANKQDRLFVSVVDLKARKMAGRIEMPNGTQGIGMSLDGSRVVAADLAEPNIRVIDTATDKVIDVVKVDGVRGGGPFRLQYSPDGRRLLTTTLGANLLNVFDAENFRGRQLVVPVGRDPFGIAFTKDGKTALVSNHGDGTISVVDVASGTVKSSFTAGTGIETLSYY
jgi:DNA-binding beta-propeller fold protein YncE